MKKTKEKFDQAYYETMGSGYDENTSFYEKLNWNEVAQSIKDRYKKLTKKPLAFFLDIGCAKGYLVEAMRKLPKGRAYPQETIFAYGVDPSAFAIKNCAPGAKGFVEKVSIEKYNSGIVVFDFISCYGTLHYLSKKKLERVIAKMCIEMSHNKTVIHLGQLPTLSITPEDLKAYHTVDASTKTVVSVDWWIAEFMKHGFVLVDNDWEVEGDYFYNLYFAKR